MKKCAQAYSPFGGSLSLDGQGGAGIVATQCRLQFVSVPELVGMAQLGSLEACDELVRRYRGAALLVAQQILGSQEAAQDVAQEAFLLAFRALPQLQDPAKFAGWLYAIVRHRARRVAAREARSQAAGQDTLERLLAGPGTGCADDPLHHMLTAETQAAVRALLDGLPPETRIVLLLTYYEGWPAARIAEFLSLPLTTIKWRLRRGRQLIGRRLAERMEENTDGRQRAERDSPDAYPAANHGPDGRACGADRQLRKRRAYLCEAL